MTTTADAAAGLLAGVSDDGGMGEAGVAEVGWTARSLQYCYREACVYFNVTPDPSVFIALNTGMETLRPLKRYELQDLLPLVDLVAKATVYNCFEDAQAQAKRFLLPSMHSLNSTTNFLPFLFGEITRRRLLNSHQEIPRVMPHQPHVGFHLTWLQLPECRIGECIDLVDFVDFLVRSNGNPALPSAS